MIGVVVRRLAKWTDWRSFPDPAKGDLIVAPFGPGCYELRLAGSGQLVLFGSAGHVAYRMSSLHPSGAGTRKNSEKRAYVGTNLPQLEYRVIAFASKDEATDFERRELWSRRDQSSSRPNAKLGLHSPASCCGADMSKGFLSTTSAPIPSPMR